ncbi:MAG: bifunctional histidinol-phosphatase/imidazoleglycerol-phosphate dehydratase HisB [Muribaculaceae bacterium]|jgi:imidazoleglycerol-phosphate dehydratase/histidinol-phosphatase|nr:bifunctional histidinol-phosphatase/imidazoleglycerol-phosphate dehydratase HisB [Muribaculaceae bacterium]
MSQENNNAPHKRVIFVDRDGSIIREPEDEQVDSLEKLEFMPGAISALACLRALDGFELVLASNQDGLGTPAFPTEDFLPPHNKMLATLKGEGVEFDNSLIDTSFPADNSPNRKPLTGMFTAYTGGGYDMAGSYVVGDRITDLLLARNLGAKGILLRRPQEAEGLFTAAGMEPVQPGAVPWFELASDSWAEVADHIRAGERRATLRRSTSETDITVTVDLDGRGPRDISTGLNFLDHMLRQLNGHSGISVGINAKGDLDVDEHHTIEDTAITLGTAIDKALGSKLGIGRYGFALPMDDARATVLIDFGGRIETVWKVHFDREYVGDTPTEMIPHFFKSFAQGAKCNLYIEAEGSNTHHIAEAVFKAFARALRMAVERKKFDYSLSSTKGVL